MSPAAEVRGGAGPEETAAILAALAALEGEDEATAEAAQSDDKGNAWVRSARPGGRPRRGQAPGQSPGPQR